MDHRSIISSAISNIENAKIEIESLIHDSQNANATDLGKAHRSLDDCVSHCHAIFGPTTQESLKIRQREGNRNG